MKRILEKLKGFKELKYVAVIFAALYLAFLLKTCLPGLALPAYLVFGGALVPCALLVFLKARFLKPVQPLETALLSLLAAVLSFFLFHGLFLPTIITLEPGGTGEVCFSDVLLDGVNSPVSDIPVIRNAGWEYRGEYDNYVTYPQGDGAFCPLTLWFHTDNVELLLVSAPWAGDVTIVTPSGRTDLYLRASEDTRLHVPLDSGSCYTPFLRFVYSVGALLALAFLWSVPLSCLNRSYAFPSLTGDHAGKASAWLDRLRRLCSLNTKHSSLLLASPVLLFLIYIRLFLASPSAPTVFTKLVLAVLTAASSLCLLSGRAREALGKYRPRGKFAFLVLAALYASFASFGQRYFLDGNTRMHGSWEGLQFLLLGTLWFIPVLCLLLLGLERLSSVRRAGGDPAYRGLAFWALLVILCACQAVVLYSFWPGGLPLDCLEQMNQAVGSQLLNDWHPVLHTLFYRIILTIWPHAGALAAVQMFFFALLLTHFLMLGYDAGVPFKVLAVLGVVFSLLPNQVLSGISPVKDYPYMLALLWGTYLLIRLALDAELLQKWWFLVAMPVDLFLIYGLRHNGVVPFLAVILLFAWITIRHFHRVKLSLTAISLAGILLVSAYRGPLFSLLNVSQDIGMSPYTTMLCAAASCVNKDLPLSDRSNEILESVLPLEQWGSFYDRYLGHDPYYWGRGDLAEEQPFDPGRITAAEAFTVYLDALFRYPDVVIKDRLDGTDLLWDLRQPSDGYNTKAFHSTSVAGLESMEQYFPADLDPAAEYYYNDSPLAEMYRETPNSSTDSVFDMLLWRSGGYLIFLLVLVLFWWGNRMKTLLWAAVPLLGNLASLALVLFHQSFRYVYAVQVIVMALAFCTVLLRDRERWAVPETAPEAVPEAGGPPSLPAEAARKSPAPVYDAETASSGAALDRIAVLIPCYNEGRSIGKVVDDFRRELPEAVIYVYDNNSTDATAEIARSHGAVVRRERQQGKGNVMRRMFREIDAQCYIMVDGDDTYPAENAREMAEAVLLRQADMVVGDRLSSTYFTQNKRPFHNLGNDLVRKSINTLFKSDIKDIMTGYRAFSYQFIKSFPVLSKGFEIETEMSIHAIDKNMRVENVVVDYRDRLEGSVSKLDTFSDGLKVLKTIVRLFQAYRPRAFFGACAAVLLALAAVFFIPILFLYSRTGLVPNLPTLIVCGFTVIAAIQSFFAGLILETINQKNRQDFELELLRLQRQYKELLQADRPERPERRR